MTRLSLQLAHICLSFGPPDDDNIGKMLWYTFGAQTTKLIHDHLHVGDVHDDLEEYVMDATVIDDLFNNPDKKKVKLLERELIKRFSRNQDEPRYKALGDRLEELRDKAEAGLISY